MKSLAFLIAVVGMAMIESLRSISGNEDDDVGLFIGSASPLAAKSPVITTRR